MGIQTGIKILLAALLSVFSGTEGSAVRFSGDIPQRTGGCAVRFPAGVLVVPDSVEVIPERAFFERQDIEEVRFSEGSRLREIGPEAFRECRSLKRIVLPESLRKIGRAAFIYCDSLATVLFPEGLERIGSNAFSRCGSLREVRLPDSVIELESYAFSDCVSLERAKLPGNPSLLGELIFSGCESLEVIEEPSAVPPAFDCESYLFEPDERKLYERVRLQVAPGSEELYKEAPGWREFFQ